MNPRPIEESGDADLIGSVAVTKRAAEHARKVARSTSTELVVGIDGKAVEISVDDLERLLEERSAHG